MNTKMLSVAMVQGRGWLRFWLPLLALILPGSAWARYQDIDLNNCPPLVEANLVKFAGPLNTAANSLTCDSPVSTGCDIATANASGDVYWTFENGPAGSNCSGATPPNLVCAGINVTLPAGTDVLAPATANALLTNSNALNALASADFYLTVTAAAGVPECKRWYRLRVTSTGGGWGDPHITTVDGVNYDFQSAGEFVALRGGGVEIQTRQTPVATATVPGANAYTGLASCVSIYTAVAARVGTHRVSYQPNIGGVPDPSGMQLRIDGVLTTLGPEGIHLGPGGAAPLATGAVVVPPAGDRILKAAVGDGIEIHYANGTKVVVASAWWQSQQKWYLNVNLYDTTATEGIMGRIAEGSWLPALADGTSVGPKPQGLHDRYMALYETFADSWRVTNATSLFDYAPGTSTDSFTLDSWPKDSPTDCAIPQEPSAQPLDAATAEKQCGGLVDENTRANCVFDVMVTGHTGFAQTYLFTQQLQPGATKTGLQADKATSKPEEGVTFTATVERTVPGAGGAPTGTLQFVLDGGNVGGPVALDAGGKAVWSTSSLQVGTHQVEAKFNATSGFGEQFLASGSPAVSHTVVAPSGMSFWLIVLLILLLIVVVVWWFLRGT